MTCSLQSSRLCVCAVVLVGVAACLADSFASAQPPGPSSPKTEVGVSVNDSRAYQGYSLIAPMNSTTTYLIDMEGRVVNRWQSDCTPALSAYLLENGHLLRTGAQPGGSIGGAGAGGRIQEFSWDGELRWDFSYSTERQRPHHDICPMPNGNVLVIAWDKKTPEEAVAAGRIPETVRGQLLADCILEVQPTGKTSGRIVWKWHAWDHLIQEVDESKPDYGEVSEHPERIDVNFGTNVMAEMIRDPKQFAKLRALGYVGGGRGPGSRDADRARDAGGAPGADRGRPTHRGRPTDRGGPGPLGGPPMGPDWMHVNSVAYNAELDQIMLSVHEFSEVWIIDHGTTTEEAASHAGGRYGMGGDLLYRWGNPRAYRNGTNADQRLFAQHCAHWIPKGLPGEGHMLVFNNGNGRPGGAYSSVDEVVLPVDENGRYHREEYLAFGPERAAWTYSRPDKGSFFSMNISGAQRLPNGNTFICSGAPGVLFEVTPGKETVWQYSTPNRGPFGRGGPGGMGPGELFPTFLQDRLQMTDDQKAKLAKLQEDVDAELDKLLTEEQREKLETPMPLGRGGPPRGRDSGDRRDASASGDRRGPGGSGRPGGPFGFTPPRPGEVLPSTVVESLDLSKKQTLQLERLQQRVDFQVARILTKAQESQLDAIQRGLAGGPGAGPPGFGPPGAGPGFGPPGFGRRGFGPPGAGPGFGPPGFGRRGFGPPGFGPSGRDAGRRDGPSRPDGQSDSGDGGTSRRAGDSGMPDFAGRDRGPGPPDRGRGGPGGGPGGPGGPGGGPGGPGGIFTCYRYGPDYPGLAGKDLTPGEKLEDLLNKPEGPDRDGEPRR